MRSLHVILVGAALAGFAACATSAVARGWIRPVDGAVVRPFSVVAERVAAGEHRGNDLAAEEWVRRADRKPYEEIVKEI